MSRAIYSLILLMLLFTKATSGSINPDGRIGHSSINLCFSWAKQDDVYSHLTGSGGWPPYIPIEEKDKHDDFKGAVGFIFPMSEITTFIIHYNYYGIYGTEALFIDEENYITFPRTDQHSILVKANIFSRSIKEIQALINPDGKSKSLVISPMLGIHSSSGLLLGIQLSYVVTNKLTIVGSDVLNKLKSAPSGVSYGLNQVSLGFHCFLNNQAQTKEKFNPDGSPGTILIAPSVGSITSSSVIKGFTTDTEIIVPISSCLSTRCTFQYTSINVENYIYKYPLSLQKSNQLNIGFGAILHF
jgi:hypothetical protein